MNQKNIQLQYAKYLLWEVESSEQKHGNIAENIKQAMAQWKDKEVDDISFFLMLKRIHYRMFEQTKPDGWQLTSFLEQDLANTFASSDEIKKLTDKVLEIEKDHQGKDGPRVNLFDYVIQPCLSYWRRYSETTSITNQTSSTITRILGLLLLVYFLLPSPIKKRSVYKGKRVLKKFPNPHKYYST